jgi:hypothetical protein
MQQVELELALKVSTVSFLSLPIISFTVSLKEATGGRRRRTESGEQVGLLRIVSGRTHSKAEMEDRDITQTGIMAAVAVVELATMRMGLTPLTVSVLREETH